METKEKKGGFKLAIEAGSFTTSQVIVLLGENGTGKTTFMEILAGRDPDLKESIPDMNISYKPQKIAPKFEGTVRELLQMRLKELYTHPQFTSDVTRPMKLDDIIDNDVQTLSGGELQRVAIILGLG